MRRQGELVRCDIDVPRDLPTEGTFESGLESAHAAATELGDALPVVKS